MFIHSAICTTSLSPAVGEEVLGLDLSKFQSSETVQALKQIVGTRGMFFARNQDLSPSRFLNLASQFGDITVNGYFKSVPGYPQIAEVLKEADQKNNIGESWHTDNSYDIKPALGSMLYALEIPPAGGDTIFVSMYAVYESLSDELKRTLGQLRAKHSTRHAFGKDGVAARKDLKGRVKTDDVLHKDAEHPIVITHPISGRKALFVNPAFTTQIAGWTEAESAGLLEYIYQQALRPEFQCRLRWENQTLAFWDNRCTWHFAVNDYSGQRRLMHRIQIEGELLRP